MISATTKVILATKNDLGHWKSDHNHLKSYLGRCKNDINTTNLMSAPKNVISITTKVIFTKIILSAEEVITATL